MVVFNKLLKNLTLYLATSEPTRLPNVGYLGDGYDIYKGNPREIGRIDPGFRLEPIFNLTLDGGTTPDGRYILPKGISAQQCISCVISFDTDYIKNIQEYTRELERSISGDIGSNETKFGASQSYKYIYKSTKEHKKKYTSNEANCMVYCMSALTFLPRELSDNFRMGVSLLTNNSDDPIYNEFINAFGTHYIYSMSMGSNFGILTEFTESSWEEMNSESEEFDISIAASLNARIKAGIEVKEREKIELVRKFESYSEKSHIHSTGASLPPSGKIEDWIPHAFENPMPQAYELKDLTDLLNSRYFPNDKNIELKRNNLKKAIDKYCLHLRNQGIVLSCDNELQFPTLTMYNCPAHYRYFFFFGWAVYGCFNQLSSIDTCQNLRWDKDYNECVDNHSCPKIEIDSPNATTIYACPVNTKTNNGERASFGCNGQLSLVNECINVWSFWNGGKTVSSCDEFDIAKGTIYKCPYDTFSGDYYWKSIGCVGQYSHIGKCYNYWWDNTGLRNISRNCHVLSKKEISNLNNVTVKEEKLLEQQAQIEIPPKN